MTDRERRHPDSAEKTVRDIRIATRRKFSAEEKIRIVLEGFRGKETIAELCRKEGIAQNLYYRWSKELLEAGKKRLAGDVAREATSDEVKGLRAEARKLKEALAEVMLENRLLKKASFWMGATTNEILRLRQAGDHPPRRDLVSARGSSRWQRSAFRSRSSMPGSTATSEVASRYWKIASPGLAGHGTAFRMMSAKESSSWALDEPEMSSREVAIAFTDREQSFASESSVYRILKANGLITAPAFLCLKAVDTFANPTTAVNQLRQTDFTYLEVTGWGWFFLSTVLDDFSRYIVSWKLCATMSATDVTETLELALQAAGLDDVAIKKRPRLLSDNGPSYVAQDLTEWLDDQGMAHTRGKPYHPMKQGQIERWHLSLKSQILLENCYLPGDLRNAVADFVEHYNHRRYHESLNNLTPADIYFGCGQAILDRREEVKRKTIEQRRKQHFKAAE